MYYFILKHCLSPKKISSLSDSDISFEFVQPFGEEEAIRKVIDLITNKKKIVVINDQNIESLITSINKTYERENPVLLVKVNKEYDTDFAWDITLALSFMQGYPALPFFVLYESNGEFKFEFIKDRNFKYNTNTLFPYGIEVNFSYYLERIPKYRYILELLFDANKEIQDGMRIAKYFIILDTLASKYKGRNHEKIKALFQDFEYTELYNENEFEIDLTSYSGQLANHYTNKNKFSYMELMTVYRNLVIHQGIMNPPELNGLFGTRNEKIDRLEFGVYLIIKTIIEKEMEIY